MDQTASLQLNCSTAGPRKAAAPSGAEVASVAAAPASAMLPPQGARRRHGWTGHCCDLHRAHRRHGHCPIEHHDLCLAPMRRWAETASAALHGSPRSAALESRWLRTSLHWSLQERPAGRRPWAWDQRASQDSILPRLDSHRRADHVDARHGPDREVASHDTELGLMAAVPLEHRTELLEPQ